MTTTLERPAPDSAPGRVPASDTCEIASKANFSFIRYSQCWEDTDILMKALRIKDGDTCLSIASAGDNTLALLAGNPSRVVALDVNPSQLALFELKTVAIELLEYDQVLSLLGYSDSATSRSKLYEEIRPHLTTNTRRYFDGNRSLIIDGVAGCGRFERYFKLFRTCVLPLVHSKSTVDSLVSSKTADERERFYANRWNSLRWRLMLRLFFSNRAMALLGRDPSFFAYAERGLPEFLECAIHRALVTNDPGSNPYLYWILKGRFGKDLPFWLRRENFNAIKRNIKKIELQAMSLEEYLASCDLESFDRFNLSDVFEYMSLDNFAKIMRLIHERAKPQARLVYWNMLVPRKSSLVTASHQFKSLDELARDLHEGSDTFFYTDFVIEEVIK